MLPPVSWGEVAAPFFPFWAYHSLFPACPQMPPPEGRAHVDLVHGRVASTQSVPGTEQVGTGVGEAGLEAGCGGGEASRGEMRPRLERGPHRRQVHGSHCDSDAIREGPERSALHGELIKHRFPPPPPPRTPPLPTLAHVSFPVSVCPLSLPAPFSCPT